MSFPSLNFENLIQSEKVFFSSFLQHDSIEWHYIVIISFYNLPFIRLYVFYILFYEQLGQSFSLLFQMLQTHSSYLANLHEHFVPRHEYDEKMQFVFHRVYVCLCMFICLFYCIFPVFLGKWRN